MVIPWLEAARTPPTIEAYTAELRKKVDYWWDHKGLLIVSKGTNGLPLTYPYPRITTPNAVGSRVDPRKPLQMLKINPPQEVAEDVEHLRDSLPNAGYLTLTKQFDTPHNGSTATVTISHFKQDQTMGVIHEETIILRPNQPPTYKKGAVGQQFEQTTATLAILQQFDGMIPYRDFPH